MKTILLAFLALVVAFAAQGRVGDSDRPYRDDPDIVAKIAALPDNTSLALPPFEQVVRGWKRGGWSTGSPRIAATIAIKSPTLPTAVRACTAA